MNQPYNAINTLSSIVNFWLYKSDANKPTKLTKWETQLDALMLKMCKGVSVSKRKRKKKVKESPPIQLETELEEWLSKEDGCPETCKSIRKYLIDRVLSLLTRKYPGTNEWLDHHSAILDVHCAAVLMYQADFIDPIKPSEKQQIDAAAREWHQRYPQEYTAKTKEAAGSATGIDAVVEKMKNGLVSKDEVMKLAQSDNMLSISVQINSRLKKLGLKMKKSKRGGDIYYGVK